MMRRTPIWLQYLMLALVWGASFLFMKVGLEGLSYGQVVLGRLASGAVALLAVCAVTRQPLPREKAVWGHLLVVAVLLCVAPFLLFAWAEQHVDSGLASIYNATTPLMTMVVAVLALPEEKLTRDRVFGLLLGFLGVLTILSPWHGLGHSSILGQLACLGATVCYGMAFTYLRKTVAPRGLPALSVACTQICLGTAVMLVLSPFLARGPVHLSGPVVLSVLALGMLGTGLAYVWNTNVVTAWGATRASTVTYLTPLVGVLLGFLLMGERLTWSEPLGAVLVVLGIMASQGRLRRPRRG